MLNLEPFSLWELADGFLIASAGFGYSTLSVIDRITVIHSSISLKFQINIGIAGVVWSLLWFILFAEDPSEDKLISTEELNYLKENVRRHERPKVSNLTRHN